MFIVESYLFAVVLSFITMLCWGSWGNTQKLAAKSWRFELFYWDYVIGILLLSLLFGFTLGSIGEYGRPFIADLKQADTNNLLSAFIGGVVFNTANILLSASISLAGMAVAFPVGIGIALVLGVFVNYFGAPKGDPFILFLGVALIVVAVILNGVASTKMAKAVNKSKASKKGIVLAIVSGILMAFFYRFVASAMDLENLRSPREGMITPYSALFIFALGIFISNFFLNTWVMKKPFEGSPVGYRQYFAGSLRTHMVGILGGMIWALGTACSYIAAGKAGPAISYGLGQGATMIAALWGILIWKEFKGASKLVNSLLLIMIVLFVIGLILIIVSGSN